MGLGFGISEFRVQGGGWSDSPVQGSRGYAGCRNSGFISLECSFFCWREDFLGSGCRGLEPGDLSCRLSSSSVEKEPLFSLQKPKKRNQQHMSHPGFEKASLNLIDKLHKAFRI